MPDSRNPNAPKTTNAPPQKCKIWALAVEPKFHLFHLRLFHSHLMGSSKFLPLQVFSGDASRPNLTPMVDALARVLARRFAIACGDLPSASLRRIPAPLLRASQPLPRDSHTEMFKTTSAMPRDTIQYTHKSKTSSSRAVEGE